MSVLLCKSLYLHVLSIQERDKALAFTEHLLHARHSAEYLTCVLSFDLDNNPARWTSCLPCTDKCGFQDYLPKGRGAMTW